MIKNKKIIERESAESGCNNIAGRMVPGAQCFLNTATL
jgi:hypothetical protein